MVARDPPKVKVESSSLSSGVENRFAFFLTSSCLGHVSNFRFSCLDPIDNVLGPSSLIATFPTLCL
jgi:hypothetical protein